MGRISKGEKCGVSGCEKPAVRSVSIEDAKAANLEIEGRRAYLCEDHYKAVKKIRRKEHVVQKWRYANLTHKLRASLKTSRQ